MYELALFAGVHEGGMLLRQLFKFHAVGYVERDPYCAEVLAARIGDGALDYAPIWSDVRSFTQHNNATRRYIRGLRKMARNLVITAGFPCQPFSAAGKRQAGADERNGWPDTIRIIREIRPRLVLLENVSGLLSTTRYLGVILGDLAKSGYDARWRLLSASEVGAPHKRDRLWIVAHTQIIEIRPGLRPSKSSGFRRGRLGDRVCQEHAPFPIRP